MDEVSAVLQELNSIIREMEEIESSLRSNFEGIYTNKAADAINQKLQQFYTARSKLQTIDRSKVDE